MYQPDPLFRVMDPRIRIRVKTKIHGCGKLRFDRKKISVSDPDPH
jgi:hypothetical protein